MHLIHQISVEFLKSNSLMIVFLLKRLSNITAKHHQRNICVTHFTGVIAFALAKNLLYIANNNTAINHLFHPLSFLFFLKFSYYATIFYFTKFFTKIIQIRKNNALGNQVCNCSQMNGTRIKNGPLNGFLLFPFEVILGWTWCTLNQINMENLTSIALLIFLYSLKKITGLSDNQ